MCNPPTSLRVFLAQRQVEVYKMPRYLELTCNVSSGGSSGGGGTPVAAIVGGAVGGAVGLAGGAPSGLFWLSQAEAQALQASPTPAVACRAVSDRQSG
jgi:hypothetical protein